LLSACSSTFLAVFAIVAIVLSFVDTYQPLL